MELPRRAIPVVWAGIVLVIMVALPWALSLLGPSYAHRIWPWRLAGLVLVAAGLGLYAWCLTFHFRTYRGAVRVGFEPPRLVTQGPYRHSRNPMYLAGVTTWLGWAILYASPAVFIGAALLGVGFTVVVIPREERQLEGLFGEEYLAYKADVRRWIGRR